MDKYNELIVLIQAFQNACKDFHYFCKSFALHLLADEINSEDFYEILDAIKENVFIAEGKNPLKAKEYAQKVAEKTPELKETDEENLQELMGLTLDISGLADSIKADKRAFNVILDNIADKMAHARTLISIELRAFTNKIEEDFKKEECKGQAEVPVDRKEAKIAPIDHDLVAKTIKDYEEQNVIVAEGDTLHRLEKKLGI